MDTNANGLLDSGDTDVTQYTWDHRNRLTTITHLPQYGAAADQTIAYGIDAFDQVFKRVLNGATTDRYAYDRDQMALRLDNTPAPKERYLWGAAVDQLLASDVVGGETRWALADHEGTVRDLIDSAGNLELHRQYDAFGRVTSQTGAATDFLFGFTGRWLDQATALQNNHHRWYDARVGRWLSEDPLSFDAGDTNLYRYSGNDPVGNIDPSGLGFTGFAGMLGGYNSYSSLMAGPAAAFMAAAGFDSLLAPRPLLPAPAAQYWGLQEYGEWFGSLATRDAVGNKATMVYQRSVCGPIEYSVQGLGDDPVWADNVKGTKIIDAKLVPTPKSSPQLGTAPAFITEKILAQWEQEFGRYKSAILDPNNPLRSVEVQVNSVGAASNASVPFWENFLAKRGIPGRAVVAGEVSTASPAIAPIVVPPVGTSGMPVSNSTAFWRTNADFYQSNAGAIGIATMVSLANGIMTGITNMNHRIGLELIANPTARPEDALHNIQYFRAQSSGWNALLFGSIDKERRRYDTQGNALPTKMESFLNSAEQYWKAQQQREAEVRARLPDPNFSIFGPVKAHP